MATDTTNTESLPTQPTPSTAPPDSAPPEHASPPSPPVASETPPAPPSEPAPCPSTLAWGILWGGAMLIIFALWLRAKFEDLSFAVIGIAGLLGALGVLFAAWMLITCVRGKNTTETVANQRNLAGLLCLTGGGIMLMLAVVLWYFLRLAGFGEYVGLALFGLVALVTGRNLLRTEPASTDALWENFRANLGTAKLALFVLGAVQLLAFAALVFWRRVDTAWFPELAALLFGGFFYVFAAFWLALRSLREIPLATCRTFALFVGGVTGLIITLMILARTFLWRDQVFLGGLDTWLGEGAWRLWLCAYVLLLGLGLMFGSLLLARADVRENPFLRRTLYGYSTILNGLLILAILIVFNILFYILVPYTFSWSATSFSALSPSSKNLLAALPKETNVFVLMSERQESYTDLKNLLDNAAAYSSKLNVKYISPDRNVQDYESLANRFKIIQPEKMPLFRSEPSRGVLIVYGDVPADLNAPLPPYAFVPSNKILDIQQDPHGGPRGKINKVFKAEAEIMRELNFLSQGKQKRKLYVLQGNEELDINNQETLPRTLYNQPLSQYGMGKLVDRFKKDEYEVQGLTFSERLRKEQENVIPAPEIDKKKSIPEDAYAVLIPGPSEPLPSQALDALERYVDRGGRLLVFLDLVFDQRYTALKTTLLEDFLKKYAVEVKNDFVIHVSSPQDYRIALASTPAKADTVLAKQFAGEFFFFRGARVVRPSATPGRYKASALLQLDDRKLDFFTETEPYAVGDPGRYIKDMNADRNLRTRILFEPLPVAVTVTEGTGDTAKPRLAVFGDADFLSNFEMSRANGDRYYDLVAGTLEWMAEKQGFIGPRPRETPMYNVPVAVDRTRLFLYPGLLMMLGIVGLGAGLWLVRRR
jgi:hypothetical protein